MKKTKYADIYGIILFGLSALMLIYSVYLSNSPDIWYDELFSMEFAESSIADMIKLTAADVHPPLYCIIAHSAVALSEMLSISAVSAVKAVSVIPYIVLFVYGITIVRKRYGLLGGGLFSFAVISMPNMSEYTVEIRMYGYVILFITAMCIHAKPFIETDKEKMIKGLKWRSVFPLFFYGLCACYTQYYAAVAVFFIYLFLVIWSIRKNVWQLGILLISGNATVICFYPWISIVFRQVGTVSENYWIQELTWRSLGGVVKYITKASFTNENIANALAVALFLLLLITVLGKIKNVYMWFCFMPLVGIVSFGFIASILIRPFFVYRYMLPGMGAFWLAIIEAILGQSRLSGNETSADEKSSVSNSVLAGKIEQTINIVSALLILLMTIIGIRDYWAFRGNELYRRVNMLATADLIRDLQDRENLVIITNFDQVDALIAFYLNQGEITGIMGDSVSEKNVLLYGYEPENLIINLVPGVGSISDGAEIRELIEDGKDVLFLGSFNSREDIVKEWSDDYGIVNVNQGSYLLERYWFDVFELSAKE